jgi:hypothetical protein
LAFGTTTVRLGDDLDWSEVARQSHSPEFTKKVKLDPGETTELGRFPNEPYAIVADGPRIRRAPQASRGHQQAKDALYRELSARLARSPSREVLPYMHGFNETFESTAFTTAELCHFPGREDVCAFFTWPVSASGNPLISYTATTESADRQHRESRPVMENMTRYDDRLPNKTYAWGVTGGDDAVCWTDDFVVEHDNLINARVGGRDLVVAWHPRYESLGAWYNDIGQPVTEIDFFGNTVGGKLERIETRRSGLSWHVWLEFFPHTEINRVGAPVAQEAVEVSSQE